MAEKRTASDQKNRKVVATYIGVEYREPLNDMLEDMEVNRYDYFKALILQDMVRREVITVADVRRKDRPLLEL